MSAHYGPASQEGLYPSSSPPSDSHEAFAHGQDPRYYDRDDAPRRNTMASSDSDAVHEQDRYYDHNGPYDPYGEHTATEHRQHTRSANTALAAPQETDSDFDVYGQKYAPSQESLNAQPRQGMSETPTFVDFGGQQSNARDQYPAWTTERQIPLSKEEIEDIFLDLTQKFGFQRDSMRNMVRPLSL